MCDFHRRGETLRVTPTYYLTHGMMCSPGGVPGGTKGGYRGGTGGVWDRDRDWNRVVGKRGYRPGGLPGRVPGRIDTCTTGGCVCVGAGRVHPWAMRPIDDVCTPVVVFAMAFTYDIVLSDRLI